MGEAPEKSAKEGYKTQKKGKTQAKLKEERKSNIYERDQELQTIDKLKNIGKTYIFEKQSNLNELECVLKEFYGMTDRTYRRAKYNMNEVGVNIHEWNAGDSILIKSNQSITVFQNGVNIYIENFLHNNRTGTLEGDALEALSDITSLFRDHSDGTEGLIETGLLTADRDNFRNIGKTIYFHNGDKLTRDFFKANFGLTDMAISAFAKKIPFEFRKRVYSSTDYIKIDKEGTLTIMVHDGQILEIKEVVKF